MSNFQLLTKPTPLSGEAHRKSPSLSFTPSLAPSSSASKSTSKSKSTSSSPSSSSPALRPTFRPLYKTLSLSYRYPSSSSSTSNPSSTNGTSNTSTNFTILLSIYKYIDLLARRLAFEFALFMLGGGFNLMLLLLWPGWIPVLGVVGGLWWVWG